MSSHDHSRTTPPACACDHCDGFAATLNDDCHDCNDDCHEEHEAASPLRRYLPHLPVAIAGVFIAAAFVTSRVAGMPQYVPTVLYALAIVAGCIPIAPGAFASIKKFSFDMNLLMFIAIIGAAATATSKKARWSYSCFQSRTCSKTTPWTARATPSSRSWPSRPTPPQCAAKAANRSSPSNRLCPATSSSSDPAKKSPSTAKCSPARRTSTSRPSPANRCRSKSSPAIRCSRALSTAPAHSKSPLQNISVTPHSRASRT